MKRIVPKFLANCRLNRIFEVRIVHGSPKPTSQRALHSVLKEIPEVACFRTGGEQAGTPGATIVVLLGTDELPPRQISR